MNRHLFPILLFLKITMHKNKEKKKSGVSAVYVQETENRHYCGDF